MTRQRRDEIRNMSTAELFAYLERMSSKLVEEYWREARRELVRRDQLPDLVPSDRFGGHVE